LVGVVWAAGAVRAALEGREARAAPEAREARVVISERALPRAAAKLAVAALSLAAVTTASEARADLIGPNQKRVKATYEITGIDEHPGYLFVAFPYGGCPMGPIPEYYEWNPEDDIAWTNYEVLRSGRSYQPAKFCWTKIYAFKASDFTTEERVLDRDIDFYRRAGYTVTIIKEFEKLKTTDKLKFVERSRSVFPSTINVNFSTLIDDTIPYTSTHDVLRVAAVTTSAARIEGVRVVVGTGDGATKEIPYRDGQRPKEVGDVFEPEPTENPISDNQVKALCAGLLAIGLIGLGSALLRRDEPKKRRGA
jgi:hypothetical protein